ncbi:MAG: helix-turn-helix transcriptional regulator, partial [Coriobacteriia bacterium]|nr:helix-turn-helix transcriptional regulator [Coriobacteriia bacterium]
FIMIVLSNITYRFGINATWLNGIERGIRYIVETLGWGTYVLAATVLPTGANQIVHIGVAVIVFVAFLAIVLSEKSLAARWGIDLHEGASGAVPDVELDTPVRPDPFAAGQLSLRVSDLSKARGLSDREEEILQLMARRVPMAQMEENLFVARGTIKAHTSRIYKKLGVHSREELYEMIGVEPETETTGPA